MREPESKEEIVENSEATTTPAFSTDKKVEIEVEIEVEVEVEVKEVGEVIE